MLGKNWTRSSFSPSRWCFNTFLMKSSLMMSSRNLEDILLLLNFLIFGSQLDLRMSRITMMLSLDFQSGLILRTSECFRGILTHSFAAVYLFRFQLTTNKCVTIIEQPSKRCVSFAKLSKSSCLPIYYPIYFYLNVNIFITKNLNLGWKIEFLKFHNGSFTFALVNFNNILQADFLPISLHQKKTKKKL